MQANATLAREAKEKQQTCSKESATAICYNVCCIKLCNATFTPILGFGPVCLVPPYLLFPYYSTINFPSFPSQN